MSSKIEFSRVVAISELLDTPMRRRISANKEERAALAKRFAVHSITELAGDLSIYIGKNGIIHLEGTAQAKLIQQSIVTLDELEFTVIVTIADRFSQDQKAIDGVFQQSFVDDGDRSMELDELDPPELVIGDEIDLGEQVAQSLSLEIDPYPREPSFTSITDAVNAGILLEPSVAVAISSSENAPSEVEGDNVEEKSNPFAVLSAFNKTASS